MSIPPPVMIAVFAPIGDLVVVETAALPDGSRMPQETAAQYSR
jgi:hypothetical protein